LRSRAPAAAAAASPAAAAIHRQQAIRPGPLHSRHCYSRRRLRHLAIQVSQKPHSLALRAWCCIAVVITGQAAGSTGNIAYAMMATYARTWTDYSLTGYLMFIKPVTHTKCAGCARAVRFWLQNEGSSSSPDAHVPSSSSSSSNSNSSHESSSSSDSRQRQQQWSREALAAMALSPFAALSLPLAQDPTWRESAAGFGERLQTQLQDTAFSDGFQQKWQKVRLRASVRQQHASLNAVNAAATACAQCCGLLKPHSMQMADLCCSKCWMQHMSMTRTAADDCTCSGVTFHLHAYLSINRQATA
jgi:hypothetical protein